MFFDGEEFPPYALDVIDAVVGFLVVAFLGELAEALFVVGDVGGESLAVEFGAKVRGHRCFAHRPADDGEEEDGSGPGDTAQFGEPLELGGLVKVGHDGDAVDDIEEGAFVGGGRMGGDGGETGWGEVFLRPADGFRVDVAAVDVGRVDALGEVSCDAACAAAPVEHAPESGEASEGGDMGEDEGEGGDGWWTGVGAGL